MSDLLLPSSDTASLNSLGYCCIEGRMKDMVIRGGENIYPAEVEQFLHKHPKVQEVQVRLKNPEGEGFVPNILFLQDNYSAARLPRWLE